MCIRDRYKLSTKHVKEYGISFPSEARKVLGLSFISSSQADFLVAHCKGLDLYRCDKSKKVPVNVKSVLYKTSRFLVNPLKGVAVLSSSANKGEMLFFQLGRNAKGVKGVAFTVQLREGSHSDAQKAAKKHPDAKTQDLHYEIPPPLTKNLKLYIEELKTIKQNCKDYKMHKYLLSELYSKDVLVHYNQSQGIIAIYTLNATQVERNECVINVDPEIVYRVHIVDDLLLVHNTTTFLYSIYDSEADHKLNIPLCEKAKVDLSHASLYAGDYLKRADTNKTEIKPYVVLNPDFEFDDIAEDEDSISPYINTHIEVKFNLLNDGVNLKANLPLKESEELKTEPLKSFSINGCIALDSNLLYHIENRRFFKYEFNKGKYLEEAKKKPAGLMDIMRRADSKDFVLAGIKQLIQQRVSLPKLYKLFKRMNAALTIKEISGQYSSHEVKRITDVLAKQVYHISSHTTVYSSKAMHEPSFLKV
eukprot:TRINITY_DN7665_c0_g1_i4.p1 TRINITY_DN7665_c0_g1~~TRINITY_DN7665_c0_g1_i4.p1  ORF type:complete len:476 (+),score=73.04 TRINITY_DN7665_c0_g1_i4:78-1505(+)